MCLGVLQDTKAAEEIAALKAWYAMLAQDSARAFYGPGHVQAAHELGAIQTLLLSDTLFRIADVAKVNNLTWRGACWSDLVMSLSTWLLCA